MEGILCFKIDWANLIVGRKFTVFALFYLVFEGNFQVQAPGGLYMEGRFNGRFFALQVWGPIFEGAYTRRGLFSEFYGILHEPIYLSFPFIHQDDELIKISKDGCFHWYLIHQIFTYLHVS